MIQRIVLPLLILLLIMSGYSAFSPSTERNRLPTSIDDINIQDTCSTEIEFSSTLSNVSEELRAVHVSKTTVRPVNAAADQAYDLHIVKIGMGTLWYLLSDQKKETLIKEVHRATSLEAENTRTYMVVCGMRDEVTAYARTYKNTTELYYDWEITAERKTLGMYGMILSITALTLFGLTRIITVKIQEALENAEQLRKEKQDNIHKREARNRARKEAEESKQLDDKAPVAAFFRGREDIEVEEEEISPLTVKSIENKEKESFT